MSSSSDIVVWCRCQRKFYLWYPFEPSLSNEIEKAFISKQSGSLDISSLSWQLLYCQIDVQKRVVRSFHGTEDPIERKVFSGKSVFGKSVIWEFESNQDSWSSFDVGSSRRIEDAYTSQQKIDLMSKVGLPYTIDIKTMTQTNVRTGRTRKIRRSVLPDAYVVDSLGVTTQGPLKRNSLRQMKAPLGYKKGASAFSQSKKSYLGHSVSLPIEKCVRIGALTTSSSESCNHLSPFTQAADPDDHKDKECAICFSELTEASVIGEEDNNNGCSKNTEEKQQEILMLRKCHHVFHTLCLLELQKHSKQRGFLQCPCCKCLHGEKLGDCPDGTMKWRIRPDLSLPGHKDCKAIQVSYDIQSGIQGPSHPNPGVTYTAKGFPRNCYIPDSDKGRTVLKLLMEAFRRRLMFTISTSVTTGQKNTVTWNDIHHKTEPLSNDHGHGYPDPHYLDNVMMELANHDITEACLEGQEGVQGTSKEALRRVKDEERSEDNVDDDINDKDDVGNADDINDKHDNDDDGNDKNDT